MSNSCVRATTQIINLQHIPMWFQSLQFLLILVSVSSSHVILSCADHFFSSQPPNPCPDHERSALIQFKHSFIIDCTTSSDSSAYPRSKSWAKGTGNCCMWDGVKCDKEKGHVIGLDLSSSCLYGTFPINSTLISLRHLKMLNLASNNFNFSKIPPALGQLDKLTNLNLSDSLVSGQIPSEILKLSGLSILDLAHNVDPLSGNSLLELRDPSLDKLLGNLTHLSVLSLDHVDIYPTVLTIFRNFTSLKVVSLKYCNLYGEFPSSVFHLPKLENINLSGNKDLLGSLPEFQPNSTLRDLHLYLTGFSGQLSPSIGNLGSLESLVLWNSHFSGMIPSTLGTLTQLVNLNLGCNDFTGYIPLSITNLTHLQSLDISKLNFRYSRDLVSWLPKLTKLNILSLHGMGLVGKISASLVNFTQITYLDLAENQLEGSIPSWVSNLTQLSELYLDGNELQGPIPQEFSQLIDLAGLGLGYNKGLFGNLNTFLKLKKLSVLDLSGVDLILPFNTSSMNSSPVKFSMLDLNYCNLTKFPEFLQNQDGLEVLSLSGNNIQGTIPKWFLNTATESLLILDLSVNSLMGFEEPLLDLPWSFLQVLDLSSNRFEGQLPNPSSSMLVYTVAVNLFTGAIPEKICSATSVNVLDFSDNKLGGPIPHCLGDQLADSLLVFNLRRNNFNGSIPRTFTKSCRLKMINLSENQLDGKLPRSLSNCKMLQVLDIGKNSINDAFPSWLGTLSDLQVLVLRHNYFHGVIPSPAPGFVFPSLRIIDLSNNFYSGYLPSGYFQYWHSMRTSDNEQDQSGSPGNTVAVNFVVSGTPFVMDEGYNYSIIITNKGNEMLYPKILNAFRVIDFSSNKFLGRIPDSIGNLNGLEALNLSNNNLKGGIPSSIGSMKGLESLDLSQNMLSGGIPQELLQLTYLEVFNVSHNNLVGPIPQGKQFNTFDNSSFDGNQGLCGSPLSKKCRNVDEAKGLPPPSVTDDKKDEDEPEWLDWVIRLLGYASGFVVGFILGKLYITDRNHEWFVNNFGRRKSKPRAKRAPKHRS